MESGLLGRSIGFFWLASLIWVGFFESELWTLRFGALRCAHLGLSIWFPNLLEHQSVRFNSHTQNLSPSDEPLALILLEGKCYRSVETFSYSVCLYQAERANLIFPCGN